MRVAEETEAGDVGDGARVDLTQDVGGVSGPIVSVFAVLWTYQLFKYATGRPL